MNVCHWSLGREESFALAVEARGSFICALDLYTSRWCITLDSEDFLYCYSLGGGLEYACF